MRNVADVDSLVPRRWNVALLLVQPFCSQFARLTYAVEYDLDACAYRRSVVAVSFCCSALGAG